MNVLCVMAHPDDEVLGCGGTLAKHAEAGDRVGFYYGTGRNLYKNRAAAARVLGLSEWHVGCFSLPDQRFELESIADAAKWLSGIRFKPDVVYTHHPGDLNLDHQFVARAVLTAFRPKPGEKPRTILACEVGSSTEWTFPQVFQPNWFETLTSGHLNKKWDAMKCYPSELHSFPHPRSQDGITTAAMYRGQQVGVPFAEAFQLLRRSC